MDNIQQRRRSMLIILFAWLAYIISYLGRSDYSANLIAIVEETGVARATAGMVSSAFALCNTVGQCVSALVMKKIPPLKMIAIELFTVAIANALLPATGSFVLMAILWGINGCMQATLLCGLMQIFAETLKEPYLSRGAVLLNTIGAVGGMINYLLSWFFIKYFRWQIHFFTVSALLVIFAILWCILMPKLTAHKQTATSEKKDDSSSLPPQELPRASVLIRRYGTVFVILGAFCVGFLRESVSLWIPSFMKDTFGFSSELSIILTAFVPCLQICGALLGGKIGRKTGNLLLASFIVFLCSGVCFLTISLFGGAHIALTLVLFVINSINMTAALTFLLSLYPVRYFHKRNISLLVGVINSFVHFGDFLSASGIGWLSENSSWSVTFLVLGIVALISSSLCFIGGYSCRKAIKEHEKTRI